MIDTIPLMPFPFKVVKSIIRGFYPISVFLVKFFPTLEMDLEEANSKLTAKDYLSGALLTFTFYALVLGFIMGAWAYRNELLGDVGLRLTIVGVALFVAGFIFLYSMIFPKWKIGKKKGELERNLLFATRHLMIQTNAGVPLFDSIVSVSEEYVNVDLDYGAISKEFQRIVKEVRSGKELTDSLEESAARNPSTYYRRIIWQLANANKAGSDIGRTLKESVAFLSDEQRISIRAYGSQLNPLALFYMLMCIIAPTMGLILLMIASTFVDIPVNEITFAVILIFLVVIQIMFIGLIKSRRPKVAL